MKEKNVNFSIDKLTVLGTIKSYVYYSEIRDLYMYNYVEFSKRKYIENQFFSLSFIVDDLGFLQIDESTLKFRLEFNPNKLTRFTRTLLNELLTYVTDYHFSRIDLAIDLYNYDIYNYNIVDIGRRKKAYYYDSIGRLETCYFGSMASNKFIRIYNKAKEQKLSEDDPNADWWRIELQLRDDNIDIYLSGFKDFLKDVFIFKYISTDIFDSTEKAIVEYILHDIHRLNEFTKNTRTKYRKILRTLELDSLDFINDFMRCAYVDVLDYLRKLCPGVYDEVLC